MSELLQLIDSANAFPCADLEGVLAAEITKMSRFYLATGLVIQFLFLSGLYRCFGQNNAFCCYLGFQGLKLANWWRSQILRTPLPETKMPR